MNKSKLPISWLSNLISRTKTINPKSPNLRHSRLLHNFSYRLKFNPISPKPSIYFTQKRHFRFPEAEEDQGLRELYAEVEREEHKEREAKRRAGIVVNEAEEEEEDYMGVGPLIDKIDAELGKKYTILDKFKDLSFLDDPTDCDSEDEEMADRTLMEEERKGDLLFKKICNRSEELHTSLTKARTLDEAFNLMTKINKFEDKHFRLLPEYRVIGDLLTRFKDATGKDKFMLAQKLNRAMKLVERKEDFNPSDSTNYGTLQRRNSYGGDVIDDDELEDRIEDAIDDDEEEFDDMKSRDDLLAEKVSAIDKMLEEKLAALDYTFGRKGKVLEEEIRKLADERNALTEKKNIPMYRKGFDIKLINGNRTIKVTKGGRIVNYSAIVACGNYNGVVGYAKAKGKSMRLAVQKAHEKCFQNLHYIDRHEDHTIAHASVTKYKKTKLYLWPARSASGLVAGPTVLTILNLAGFKDVKSKIIGSRNPHNTVRALFQALNAIETPKDVQEKFGRTVVESHLL